ncbi:hypothetical protein L596_001316 [Steinernema carpocapsae]|uniref:Secreted protein n=1 Tax=Steinernema carpocapsae TaxID=34508 RepID=A0A4V6I7C9_STECR|nr:hypothetical protein L596_001316 [Steinernema carpocapsae]
MIFKPKCLKIFWPAVTLALFKSISQLIQFAVSKLATKHCFRCDLKILFEEFCYQAHKVDVEPLQKNCIFTTLWHSCVPYSSRPKKESYKQILCVPLSP